MDLQLISAIIFLFLLTLILFLKRKNIKMQKIVYPLIYFLMYKTKIGLRPMDMIAKKNKKFLNYLGYFMIFLGFAGMVFIVYILIQNIYNIIVTPAAAPGVALVLPFKVKGSFYVPFFYWIISIFVIATVHEFSHGIMSRLHGVKIKSSGLAFLAVIIPIIPAAFVEPDEKMLRKKPKNQQLSILAAGPFANIMLAFVVLLISFFVVTPVANNIIEANGVLVQGYVDDVIYPAQEAGIKEGEIIQGIDNATVKTMGKFGDALREKNPGDSVVIKTDKKSYNVTLAKNPENNQSYLGVYISQSTRVKPGFRARYGIFTANTILWLVGLLYWLYLLNLGIGLFNLVPIGPIDGGRMVHVALLKFFKKKRAERIWIFISYVFLAVVIVSLLYGFFK